MGVTRQGNKWRARRWRDGKNVSIGVYDTEAQAQNALQIFIETGMKPRDVQEVWDNSNKTYLLPLAKKRSFWQRLLTAISYRK